jgi:hypothetical protein
MRTETDGDVRNHLNRAGAALMIRGESKVLAEAPYKAPRQETTWSLFAETLFLLKAPHTKSKFGQSDRHFNVFGRQLRFFFFVIYVSVLADLFYHRDIHLTLLSKLDTLPSA